MADGVVGWMAAAMALGVATAELPRLRAARGSARYAVGVEMLMALCMTAMALPVTAALFSGQRGWAGVFAAIGLGCAVTGVREVARTGWRAGRHWFHHSLGCGAMLCMTLAMEHASGHAGMTTRWGVACALLALYFLLSMAVSLHSRLLGGAVAIRAPGPPDCAAVPTGRIAMGGIMAVMLILMM